MHTQGAPEETVTTSPKTISGLFSENLDTAFRRQIRRVAGRESGSPELLENPRTSPEVPELPQKFSQCRISFCHEIIAH